MQNSRTGVLLINLGTPQTPTPKDVGTYLGQFLMDPFVIPLPWFFRWILVKWLIVPRRKFRSATLYKKIWRKDGSPLEVYTRRLAESVAADLGDDYQVSYGMRYGQPSIRDRLTQLAQTCEQVMVVPLYPQFAESTVTTSVHEVSQVMAEFPNVKVDTFPVFYDADFYVDSYVAQIKAFLSEHQVDRLLFSFHGLPEAYLKKRCGPGHCLKVSNCCEQFRTKAPNCYRAQCLQTAKQVVEKLGVDAPSYQVVFQSRLGQQAWIQPYLDDVLEELPAQGSKRVLVLCPSFLCDCLETLEEIAIGGRETFLQRGGQDFHLLPCLNDDQNWVQAFAHAIRERKEGA